VNKFARDSFLAAFSRIHEKRSEAQKYLPSDSIVRDRNAPASGLLTPLHISTMERLMTVENIISIGLLGWLAAGIVLMGLGIW
jgi:hypothetical protein